MTLLPSPSDWATLKAIAEVVGASTLYPHSAADALVCMLHGASLGIAPIPSLSAISALKGRPVISASAQLGLAHRSGVETRELESSDHVVSLEFSRGGVVLGVSRFTVEDAKRAQLSSPNWRTYPQAMLFARAVTQGVRRYCPGVLGCSAGYDPEEVRAGDTDLGELEEVAGVQLRPLEEAPKTPPPAPPPAPHWVKLGAVADALGAATTLGTTEVKRRIRAAFGAVFTRLTAEQVYDLADDLAVVAEHADPVAELGRYCSSIAARLAEAR
jgi:hypothetical protein